MGQFHLPLSQEQQAQFRTLTRYFGESMTTYLTQNIVDLLERDAEAVADGADYEERKRVYLGLRQEIGRSPRQLGYSAAELARGVSIPRAPTQEELDREDTIRSKAETARNMAPEVRAMLAQMDAEAASTKRQAEIAAKRAELAALESVASPQDTLPRPRAEGGHDASMYPNGNPWDGAQ